MKIFSILNFVIFSTVCIFTLTACDGNRDLEIVSQQAKSPCVPGEDLSHSDPQIWLSVAECAVVEKDAWLVDQSALKLAYLILNEAPIDDAQRIVKVADSNLISKTPMCFLWLSIEKLHSDGYPTGVSEIALNTNTDFICNRLGIGDRNEL
jgi:hypothetical protein